MWFSIGTITHHSDNKQVLDKLQVERERGITVKAQVSTMSLLYNFLKIYATPFSLIKVSILNTARMIL